MYIFKFSTSPLLLVSRRIAFVINAHNFVNAYPDISNIISIGQKEVLMMTYFGEYLSVILRVLSSKQKADVEKYKNVCTGLYIFLLENFPRIHNQHLAGPWISITSTLHKVLGHSWKLMELNDGDGLGKLEESEMEGCNKVLRKIRTNLSQKTSPMANLVDTVKRMWTGSDPLVVNEKVKAQPFCKHCDVYGHSIRYCTEKNILSNVVTSDDKLFNDLTMKY